MNYYNENDPKAAEWLRVLMLFGQIPQGVVDERSIEDVGPADLAGFNQCHFFAGIGGWSLALTLAEWPSDRPVWTGSCPCQPFSVAGKGDGTADKRHLWPAWFGLIKQCRPATVFGEQVASPAGLGWFDGVSTDLEASGYAVGAADLCAAGVGAPHIRQRLWFVGLGDSERNISGRRSTEASGTEGAGGRVEESGHHRSVNASRCVVERPSTSDNPWRDSDWLLCRDERWRQVEPGTFPLADGLPGRVGLLRGYGNAIVPQAAAEFIGAVM